LSVAEKLDRWQKEMQKKTLLALRHKDSIGSPPNLYPERGPNHLVVVTHKSPTRTYKYHMMRVFFN